MSRFLGPLQIGIAAVIWATDTLVRYPAAAKTDTLTIVFSEHVAGVLAMLPFLYWRRSQVVALGAKEWLSAAWVGAGGSAIATVLFTASFAYVNPSVVILIQKLQPVFTVLWARVFLGEKPAQAFYGWAFVALGAGLALSFPDFKFGVEAGALDPRSQGTLYAFGAAMIWAIATIGGKVLLVKTPPIVATFWRFVFGLLTLAALMLFAGKRYPRELLGDASFLTSAVYMGAVVGALSMWIYYRGLSATRASVSTFVELIFPIGGIAINWAFLGLPLSGAQLAWGAVLLFAVTMVARTEPS